MSETGDVLKPLRGPSMPLYKDLNVELPFISKEEIDAVMSRHDSEQTIEINAEHRHHFVTDAGKPMRGHTSCLVHYDDFAYMSEEDKNRYRQMNDSSALVTSRSDVLPLPDTEFPSVRAFMNDWINALKSNSVDRHRENKVWVRFRVPSKLEGRVGTRRNWKRNNPPCWMYFTIAECESLRITPSLTEPVSFNYVID